jgi:hypothetical protein
LRQGSHHAARLDLNSLAPLLSAQVGAVKLFSPLVAIDEPVEGQEFAFFKESLTQIS